MSEGADRFIQALHQEEVLYRSQGKYELAVQAQRLASASIGQDLMPRTYEWWDRGADRTYVFIVEDGILKIGLSRAALWHYMTPDRASDLIAVLSDYLWLVARGTTDDAIEIIPGGVR